MRKTTPMRVGDLWAEFVQGNAAVRRHLAEGRVDQVWMQLVGSVVAARTTLLKVERGVLYAHIDSAVMRNEIFMRREELKDAINRELGVKVINVLIVKG